MRKVKYIFQELLKFTLLFLLCFIWIRYFIRKLWLATFITLIASIVLYLILFFVSKVKQNKLGLKSKEKEDAENMFLSLACCDNPINFFCDLVSKKYTNITKHKEYLLIKYEEQTAKTIVFPDMSFEGLNIPRFMNIYNKIKKEKANKIVICCKSIIDKQLISFISNFSEKIIILDEYETYNKLYKKYDCFPEITKKYSSEKKMFFKDFIAYSFNKKRTKGYLFSAFVLVISGLFVRTTIYYCIIASILVVFALISQFNPYFNVKNENEVL